MNSAPVVLIACLSALAGLAVGLRIARDWAVLRFRDGFEAGYVAGQAAKEERVP